MFFGVLFTTPIWAPRSCDSVVLSSFTHITFTSKHLISLSLSLFLLSQADPTSIELCYYKDGSKQEKKRVIALNSIIGIRPTPKIGSADNIFAIETKEKKYVLKAADMHTKNIWLAKLCEYCGQGEGEEKDGKRVKLDVFGGLNSKCLGPDGF